jgi:RimJ/RimL family protein N-acetyltransferase
MSVAKALIPSSLIKGMKRSVRFSPTLKFVHPIGLGGESRLRPLQKHRRFVQLHRQDIQQLQSRYGDSVVPMEKRLEAGDACYAIQNELGQVECFQWVASGRSLYIPEAGADVWVPENVAYFYGAFTFPELRGQGLMTELKREVVAILASSRPPDHRCEAWVMRSNKANIRSLEKAGWKVQESFLFASVGPIHLSVGRAWLREGWL